MRAVVHFERLHDGFATLFRKLAEFDTESVETISTIGATDPETAKAFLDAQRGRPLRESCHLAQGPLMVLCLSLIQEVSEDEPLAELAVGTRLAAGPVPL